MEGLLLQEISIEGQAISRSMVVLLRYWETLEATSPSVELHIDDPARELDSIPTQATLSLTLALDADREKAQKESEVIQQNFTILRKRSSPDHLNRHVFIAIREDAMELLLKTQILLPSATPKEVFSKAMPAARVTVGPALPAVPFHCLHERPVVALQRYLSEMGCGIYSDRSGLVVEELTKLMKQRPDCEFFDAETTATHVLLKLTRLSEDFLSKELHRRQPFGFDVAEGVNEIETPPDHRQLPNELVRRKATVAVVPSLDFQSPLTLKFKAGSVIHVNDDPYLVSRACWQVHQEQGLVRVLAAKLYDHKGELG